jgi:hypothetical protein
MKIEEIYNKLSTLVKTEDVEKKNNLDYIS